MKKSLSFSAFIFIGSMILMRFSGLIGKLVLARVITPYEYGLITLLAISLPGFIQIFTNSFIFEMISHSTEGKKYFGFSMIYALISSFLIMLLSFIFHEEIFTFLNLPQESWFFYWIILLISVISVTMLGNFIGLFRGMRDYSLASFVSLAPALLRLPFLIIAVYFLSISDFKNLILIFSLPPLIILFAMLIYRFKPILNLTTKSRSIPSREMFLFGISVFLVGIFTNFMQHISKIIISHDLGILYQGYFDVSLSVLSVLAFSFSAMQFVAIPEATNSKEKEDILSKRGGLGDTTKGLFAFMIYCLIILCVYAKPIVELLFSKEYLPAADYIYILAIGYIFLFIQQFLAYLNISMSSRLRDYKNLFLITLAMLISFPLVTHFSILYFGFMGAYLSTTIVIILYSLVTIYYSKDRSPLYILLQKADRLVIISVATFGLIYYFNPQFIIGSIIALIIYSVLIFFSGYIDKELITNLLNPKKIKI